MSLKIDSADGNIEITKAPHETEIKYNWSKNINSTNPKEIDKFDTFSEYGTQIKSKRYKISSNKEVKSGKKEGPKKLQIELNSGNNQEKGPKNADERENIKSHQQIGNKGTKNMSLKINSFQVNNKSKQKLK